MHRIFITSRHAALPPFGSSSETQDSSVAEDQDKSSGRNKRQKPKKKAETGPIVDFDMIAVKNKKNRPDLVLQETGSLPSVFDRDFSAALQAKIDIINVDCWWEDPDADRAAKEVKTETLLQLLELAMNIDRVKDMSETDLEKLIMAVERPIFRYIPEVEAKFLTSDDLVVLTETSWPHLSKHFEILLALVKAAGKDGGDHFSIDYVKKLTFRFYSPDMNERTYLAEIIIAIRTMHPEYHKDIRKFCLNVLTNYLDGVISPHAVLPAMLVLANFVTVKPPTESDKGSLTIYEKYILPMFAAPHYCAFGSQMARIVEIFLRSVPNVTAVKTMKAIVKHFPYTKPQKAVQILPLLTKSLQKMKTSELKEHMLGLFLLYAKCLATPCIKVSEASVSVWNKIELEPLIMDNAKTIYQVIYPILSQAMKECWTNDIGQLIDSVFQVLNRIDSFVFQDLCRQKKSLAPKTDELKQWASIAREAARHDNELNLGSMLVHIQKTFSVASDMDMRRSGSKQCLSPTPAVVAPAVQLAKNRTRSVLNRPGKPPILMPF
jgi:hypothetical protein